MCTMNRNRLQVSSDAIIPFNSAMHDRTYSSSFGLTALRSVGEGSSFMINAGFSDSRQVVDTADDFDSYSLTFAFDTTIGNQSISPYLSLSKTDNQDDADNFATGAGIGGFFPVGDRNSFSYGYAYSESKNNRNLNDTTADETNAIGHNVSLGHDFALNEIISTSTGLGYSISEAKVGSNDFHTYDFSLRLNLAQYSALAAFAQFGTSDLDDATRAQLERGRRSMEILKQEQFVPLSLAEQVTVLFAINSGLLDEISVEQIKLWEQKFREFIQTKYSDINESINESGTISDEVEKKLTDVIKEFNEKYKS